MCIMRRDIAIFIDIPLSLREGGRHEDNKSRSCHGTGDSRGVRGESGCCSRLDRRGSTGRCAPGGSRSRWSNAICPGPGCGPGAWHLLGMRGWVPQGRVGSTVLFKVLPSEVQPDAHSHTGVRAPRLAALTQSRQRPSGHPRRGPLFRTPPPAIDGLIGIFYKNRPG